MQYLSLACDIDLAIEHEILKQYWGYDQFRPRQEDIIHAILNGHDTLALLPTGGGKSICFQVPALCMDGIAIVVSPLLSLMNDQVTNLRKRNIEAYTINASMSKREMDRVLDNCIYGKVKFLYVSPERLRNELFLERFKKMKPSFLAVDEAHCISQWGYDFRPDYLLIADVRKLVPGIPVLALTASATPAVVADIQDKLLFKQHHVIGTSFARPNLSYNVAEEEDKAARIGDICLKMAGSGIVYCSTRQRTRDVANDLTKRGISALPYNAGMSISERDTAFRKWMSNDIKIMCATNAFGMGIDKPDVRFVLHADVPSQPEAYFQEAGRAGRDGLRAYAVLLWNKSDISRIEKQIIQRFPPKEFLRKVYKAIGNYLQIAPGAGMDIAYPFNLTTFCRNFDFNIAEATYALQILELAGYICLNDISFIASKILIVIGRQDLYSYQVVNPPMDALIRVLLRMYGGLFEQYVSIREVDVARNSGITISQLREKLLILKNQGVIDYEPRTEGQKLTFLTGRMHEDSLIFTPDVYEQRKRNELERADVMERYITKSRCRNVQLLSYFGEKFPEPCGICDVCRESKRHGLQPDALENLSKAVTDIAMQANVTMEELVVKLSLFNKEQLIEFVRWKLDQGELVLTDKLTLAIPGLENE